MTPKQEPAARKTKIIATLGPATASPERIAELIEAGVDVFRLNMSHATHDWIRGVIRDIRSAAAARQKFIGIMMDTQGPSIRTGDLPVPLELKPGQKFTLTVRGERSEEERSVDVNYADFVNDISVGDVVLIDNGSLEMKVLAKSGNKVQCQVLTEGKLGSRRHINLPGVKVNLPALTAKDIADVRLGLEAGVDFIALSFVREAADIRKLREMFPPTGPRPLVIAKIEDQEAVQNLEAITQEANAIMVARGDLGIELPYEELPIIQRRIIKTCLRVGRPVIVATHILESMIDSPSPTRAEVTDAANAVFEQADAVMLSGETTVGKYPVKCVEVLDRIARRIERSGGANYSEQAVLGTERQKLVKSAVVLANETRAEAILVLTRTGNMAHHAAWLRPRYSHVCALCETAEVATSLSLNWGTTAYVVPFDSAHPQKTIETAISTLMSQGRLRPKSLVVVVASIMAGEHVMEAVQMRVL